MASGFLYLAIAATIAATAALVELALGNRRIRELRALPPGPRANWPKLSVIVAARDEERHIEEALASLLALDYDDLEIVAIDDRSTDATGAVLDRLATCAPRLRVLHVHELPSGWLGKNHALARGAELATGELLLFVDADVVLEKSAARRAVHALIESKLDHLTASPHLRVPHAAGGLSLAITTFTVFFGLFIRPWNATKPGPRGAVGIGAFNLLRAATYRAIGTHRAIALRPDDDIKLGKLVKLHGGRQELVFGLELVHVEWYATLRQMVRGLEKNMFAGVEYRLSAVIASTALIGAGICWPYVGVFTTTGATQWLSMATSLLWTTIALGAARKLRQPTYLALGFPLGVLIFLYMFWRSTILALARGGIIWRGTLYPLAQLRRNRI
ncbi:MAG: glycosyltransferase [Planctomycetota bacterium]